jgi:putative peptidoglycan lipid II flippase
MSRVKQAAKSTMIIIIFTIGSKFLGFFRETLIASRFGSGMATDTYFVATSAIGLLTGLISRSISTTFVPVLSEIEAKEGKEGKISHTNNMINIVAFLSLALIVLGITVAPILVRLLAKGFRGEQYNLAIKLTRIGFPGLLFSGIIGALTGFLYSEQRHYSSAALGFPLNFVYIIFLIFLSGRFGITGLMVTTVIAAIPQFLIQLPEAKKAGYKYRFVFDLKDKYITKVLYLSIPVFIAVAISDLNVIIDRTIASDLIIGSISALSYSNRIKNLVSTIFISAIVTVIFPLLSKESNRDNIPGMKKIMAYSINIILLITIPSTVGLIVLATPIVKAVFQRGQFDEVATLMTSKALVFYSLGLVSTGLRTLLTRVYYSLQDTKTPLINGIISLGFNIIFNLILVRYMAHAGLALATSIALTVTVIFMFYKLKRTIGSLGTVSYIKCGIKSGIASLIMGGVSYGIYHRLYTVVSGASGLRNLISLVITVILGVTVYGILCYLFGIKEVNDIFDKGLRRNRRADKTRSN